MDEAGADRVLYGSDIALMDPRAQLGKIITADISEEAKRMVCGGNAARLLGILMGACALPCRRTEQIEKRHPTAGSGEREQAYCPLIALSTASIKLIFFPGYGDGTVIVVAVEGVALPLGGISSISHIRVVVVHGDALAVRAHDTGGIAQVGGAGLLLGVAV